MPCHYTCVSLFCDIRSPFFSPPPSSVSVCLSPLQLLTESARHLQNGNLHDALMAAKREIADLKSRVSPSRSSSCDLCRRTDPFVLQLNLHLPRLVFDFDL